MVTCTPPTDYDLCTPWKRKITAPQAATTFLGTRRCSVMLLAVIFRIKDQDIGKAVSYHTISPPFPIHGGTKRYEASNLLQNNHIHILGNVPY
jgi:hypothetical protein